MPVFSNCYDWPVRIVHAMAEIVLLIRNSIYISVLFCFRVGSRSIGGYARSEAEVEQIMDGLHEQEVTLF